MDKAIASIILAWHAVYVSLTESIEDARVVLDQSDRGTLLPDRVREMRGHLINVRGSIPELADLLEELTGETVWPMKVEDVAGETPHDIAAHEAFKSDREEAAEDTEPPATAEGDYTADGSTPGADDEAEEDTPVDEEDAAETQAHTSGKLEVE